MLSAFWLTSFSLRSFHIDETKCKGCSKCARGCPASAITGQIKHPFSIDTGKYLKCSACLSVCPFGAVYAE